MDEQTNKRTNECKKGILKKICYRNWHHTMYSLCIHYLCVFKCMVIFLSYTHFGLFSFFVTVNLCYICLLLEVNIFWLFRFLVMTYIKIDLKKDRSEPVSSFITFFFVVSVNSNLNLIHVITIIYQSETGNLCVSTTKYS